MSLRIPFEQFLIFPHAPEGNDYSRQVKQQPSSLRNIPEQYGVGHILTAPLVGNAGLAVMECRFHQDTEIYADQVMQDNLSFTICLNGSMQSSSSGNRTVRIQAQETLFARYVNCRTQSSFFSGEQDCVFITIQLGPDWLSSERKQSESDILCDPFWQGIYNSGQASELMLAAAHELVHATNKLDYEHHYICAKAMELWSYQVTLLRRLSPAPNSLSLKLRAQDIAPIHLAAEILQREMIDPPSLLQLSRRIGINDNKLKQGFKQIYGTTAFAFLQQQRLQRAKTLISQEDHNVLQASTAVGYRSVSHFSTLFKHTFGISPKQLL